MSRRNRRDLRMLEEQNTVGMHRDERKEQEELAGRKKVEAAKEKKDRLAKLDEHEPGPSVRPRRMARVGKPLKR
jgi:hypothetical protein